MAFCASFCSNIVRKKDVSVDLKKKELKKALTLLDLTLLSIGSMVGSGLYVLTGSVAHDVAGPSIILSYIIAAVASGFSAICYAEFAARLPVTGSAYQFTYLSMGEIWAFLVGWNVFIEHAVSVAAVCKSWSGYLDVMVGNVVSKYLSEHLPMPGGMLAKYPDFLAGVVVLIATIVLSLGINLSSKAIMFFTTLNFAVILFIICTGLYLAELENWTNKNAFFPYGWSGTISGAATLIFSYVGYEVVASATEEAINSKRDIPLSLLISLIITTTAYVGASCALTLMVPWQKIVVASPFPSAYQTRGWSWAKYVISVGALAAMTAVVLTGFYTVPRYIYAMARDGLLMDIFAKVKKDAGIPLIATLVSGAICFFFIIVFSLESLVEFISIGQLTACTFVSICVIKLRYAPNMISSYGLLEIESVNEENIVEELSLERANRNVASNHITPKEEAQFCISRPSYLSTASPTTEKSTSHSNSDASGKIKLSFVESKFGILFQWTQNYSQGKVPFFTLLLAILFTVIAVAMLLFGQAFLKQWWFDTLIALCILVGFSALIFISAFNQNQELDTFKVPFVPYVPFISIIINITLILKLNPLTWLRFAVWLALGLIVYFGYGYRNSKARRTD